MHIKIASIKPDKLTIICMSSATLFVRGDFGKKQLCKWDIYSNVYNNLK